MTRRRGDLYRDVLSVMPPGVILDTATIAAAVPSCTRALVGVALCRATKKGLVVRADAAPGTQTGTRPATWMATGAVYEVGRGGGRPQPDKPHSRHKPRRPKPAPRTPAQVAHRERVFVQSTQPAPEPKPKPIQPQTVADYLASGGRIEVLPGVVYQPPSRLPVGWKS